MPKDKTSPSRKKILLALGAGVGVAALALASAAGLGSLTVDNIGSENSAVTGPFADGLSVTWGKPVYSAATKSYVVNDFTISRSAAAGLPVGTIRVTVADARGASLTEATATTTGASGPQLFTLKTPLSIDAIGKVSIVLQGAGSGAPNYAITPEQIGAAPGSVWVTTGAGAATIVTDDDKGDVLKLAGENAGMTHGTTKRVYPTIDNAYDARLDWMNFLSGSANGEIDPVTGLVLNSSGIGTVSARVEDGSTLWLDIDVAYGDTSTDLDVVRLSCRLDASAAWSTIDLRDCSDLDDDLNFNWIVTEDWSFTAWDLGPYTYVAGEHYSAISGMPSFATVAGYGFHVEGGGAAWIDGIDLRNQTIGFAQ